MARRRVCIHARNRLFLVYCVILLTRINDKQNLKWCYNDPVFLWTGGVLHVLGSPLDSIHRNEDCAHEIKRTVITINARKGYLGLEKAYIIYFFKETIKNSNNNLLERSEHSHRWIPAPSQFWCWMKWMPNILVRREFPVGPFRLLESLRMSPLHSARKPKKSGSTVHIFIWCLLLVGKRCGCTVPG